MPLQYRNRSYVIQQDHRLAEAFDDVMKHLETVMKQTNSSPAGEASPPPNIGSITVVAAGGIFDVSIFDNTSQVSRGVNYFVEYSLSPQFSLPVVIDLGASRNWRGSLGNQTFYFRAYSSYPTSARSAPVCFGPSSNPTAVVGGGATAGPTVQKSNGSGTSIGASGGDGGFGNEIQRFGTQ